MIFKKEKEFFKLVKRLVFEGYNLVIVRTGDSYLSALSPKETEKNLRLGFCTPSEECYTYISGKIAADHKDCFDKWSKCPLILPFPETEEQMKFLLTKLEFWASDEGYTLSNSYECDKWIKEYPNKGN